MDESSKSARILQLARERGVLRPKDLLGLGIQAEYLRRLCARGDLVKLARGSYSLPGASKDASLNLAITARAVPHGVVCLRSALAFHGLGPAVDDVVWLAIERRAAQPRVDEPPLHIARLGGEAFSAGIETHTIAQVAVRVYSVEKTLADLFKFRNKIGPHRAVDALREALRVNRVDLRKLRRFARIDRVERVMQPYVDALKAEQ